MQSCLESGKQRSKHFRKDIMIVISASGVSKDGKSVECGRMIKYPRTPRFFSYVEESWCEHRTENAVLQQKTIPYLKSVLWTSDSGPMDATL